MAKKRKKTLLVILLTYSFYVFWPRLNDDNYYFSGESNALSHLEKRLSDELKAFMENSFLPNRRNPELLCPPKSLSPDLKFGSLSIRKFYWGK